VNHPNICHLYDVGVQDGTSYLVMTYLEGETLADRPGRGALPREPFFEIGIEICEDLEKAHRCGVIHRDLKPGGGEADEFRLGEGRVPARGAGFRPHHYAQHSDRESALTAQGTVVGTFQYMSPEQLEGREANSRLDVFPLGAMLYEILIAGELLKARAR
jgi:serine/threonine protein kinase